MIKELKEVIEISKELQKKEFIIGFEMQKDLDPLIDKSVKRILATCTELLISNREMNKMSKWHDIQQQNLLPKSELIWFVEEQRPSAASSFISKYCEMSSSYYASCAKGFFENLKREEKKIKFEHVQPVLIGDPIEGDDIKSRRRSSLASLFTRSHNEPAKMSSSSSSSGEETSESRKFIDIPFDAANLLIELLKRESSFFKEFFGSTAYVRRKTVLMKIFSKSFSIIKTNLKDKICENLDAIETLKMMSELTNLEVQVISFTEFASTPTQWLNEIQGCLFEDFKRLIKKQIESLKNYSELKISLTSGELRHHFVVKRFSNFMKRSLEILKTFQRPWDILQVELKKLEHSFYGWMMKVSGYLKDNREALVFQINNFDLVMETCSPVAGIDFMTSLKFKFDHLIDKFIKYEQERYFYDLVVIIKSTKSSDAQSQAQIQSQISDINSKLLSSIKAVAESFKSSTFIDFSSLKVSEIALKKFEEEAIALYKQYSEIQGEKDNVEMETVENILKEMLVTE